jgi:hypothetical protein
MSFDDFSSRSSSPSGDETSDYSDDDLHEQLSSTHVGVKETEHTTHDIPQVTSKHFPMEYWDIRQLFTKTIADKFTTAGYNMEYVFVDEPTPNRYGAQPGKDVSAYKYEVVIEFKPNVLTLRIPNVLKKGDQPYMVLRETFKDSEIKSFIENKLAEVSESQPLTQPGRKQPKKEKGKQRAEHTSELWFYGINGFEEITPGIQEMASSPMPAPAVPPVLVSTSEQSSNPKFSAAPGLEIIRKVEGLPPQQQPQQPPQPSQQPPPQQLETEIEATKATRANLVRLKKLINIESNYKQQFASLETVGDSGEAAKQALKVLHDHESPQNKAEIDRLQAILHMPLENIDSEVARLDVLIETKEKELTAHKSQKPMVVISSSSESTPKIPPKTNPLTDPSKPIPIKYEESLRSLITAMKRDVTKPAKGGIHYSVRIPWATKSHAWWYWSNDASIKRVYMSGSHILLPVDWETNKTKPYPWMGTTDQQKNFKVRTLGGGVEPLVNTWTATFLSDVMPDINMLINNDSWVLSSGFYNKKEPHKGELFGIGTSYARCIPADIVQTWFTQDSPFSRLTIFWYVPPPKIPGINDVPEQGRDAAIKDWLSKNKDTIEKAIPIVPRNNNVFVGLHAYNSLGLGADKVTMEVLTEYVKRAILRVTNNARWVNNLAISITDGVSFPLTYSFGAIDLI